MKHFNLKTKSVKSLFLLLAMLLGGTSPTWADNADFENSLPDGWGTVGTMEYYERPKTGTYSIGNSANQGWDTNRGNYITTTKLEGTVTFWIRSYASNKTGYITLFKLSDDGQTVGDKLQAFSSSSTTFAEKSYTLTSATRLAIVINYAHLDNMTYTPYVQASGPGFAVKDGSTNLTSPYAYNFGLATAGTTKEFILNNPGTAATPIAIDVTGANGFTATIEGNATSIPASESKTLTITMPNASASGSIVVTPTGDGLSAFTFNVSGTLRDPNKVYLDFSDGQMPEGWTSVQTGSYTNYPWTAATGYIGTSGTSTSYTHAFTSPKLTFAKDEVVMFKTARYNNKNYWDEPYTCSISIEYSLDGSTWTAIGSAFTDDAYGAWTQRSVTIPVEGVKYIRFNGYDMCLTEIYGGELPNEPKMVVTQPASLDYGIITENTAKTFTIANTGKATLNGISVTSGNAAFTISNAPTSLAAGASQEVTITMSSATTGALSSLITVSATDMEDVTFTVTGVVLPDGLSKEKFTDGLPANWTNASWTFENGIATGKSSSAYLTTPKLTISSGDLIVLKARRYDSDTSDYLTVQGSSDNGSTWTAYSKKLQNADGLTYPDFGTIVLGDIPTTVNKLRFVGFYAEIDEIWGLTYAPVLSVTTGNPATAVSTPANYDFGECAADATVTYNFANAGAGTINITNVAITGDGAAAYSTNWTTSVAAPFDLTITRSYNAERTTAQAAVVTVTTSEGAFVINVTGTDKAANAPELAVSTNAIDFGKVTADAVETVTVTNNGTGSMTVDIASDNAAFEVSAAQLTEIGAGESKTFDITFKYGTPYGVKNGNVTVTPTYDATAAQTITVTGKAKDPNVWSEDFASNTLPTGWDAGTNWTIADGVAKGTWSSTASYLTTAPLTVSATTDELTFDYVTTAGNVSITIQMSKDGGAWETCAATPAIPTYMANGTAGTAILTGFEPGNYQFRFKNDDYNLDNFEGFVLNLPDHMASITEYTIPASSSYSVTMKEGQSFDATVTVKESRGVAEELTAKLYMGEEVIGTKTGSVAANGTETLTITCTPTVAAPEGAEMHIEVEWAGTKMTTETVTRYVAAITNLTLDETSSDAVVAGTYDNVTLKRKFNAGWNTVCLPFTISNVEGFFGAGAKAYNYSSYNSTSGELGFTAVTKLTASYPYVVYVPAAITEDIALTNITIASGDATAFYRYQSGTYFRGTYAPVAAGAWTKSADTDIIYGVTSDGHIKKAGSNASIKGFRAYFDLPAGAAAPSISFEDTTTGITNLTPALSEGEGAVYNLNGQKVQNAQKGLYIVNGRKVVIK